MTTLSQTSPNQNDPAPDDQDEPALDSQDRSPARTGGHDIAVLLADPGWTDLGFGVEQVVVHAVTAALEVGLKNTAPQSGHSQTVEVSVSLVDDSEIQRLNAQYRGQDKTTNVLSFSLGEGEELVVAGGLRPLGDVVLARETLQREAKAEGKALQAHVAHLCVHGVLHLLGFDHLSAGEAKVMEGLESQIMESLGYADPYQGESVA